MITGLATSLATSLATLNSSVVPRVVAAQIDWHDVINFDDYAELLPLVRNSIIAGVLLGVLGGLVSVVVMARDLPFAVHGISELSFAGAAGALLFGGTVVTGAFVGSLAAAMLLGVLGLRARDRNSVTGAIMPFGLGLGILFLTLYDGRASNKFGLLTGQIVSVDSTRLSTLAVTTVFVLAVLAVVWRPLMFASVDPDVASARGVPTRALGTLFMVLLGCAVALSVQVVGALLVLALLVVPAAAAMRVTASPVWVPLLSTAFALVSMVGGILVAVGTAVPISPYVTTIAFVIYVVCRVVGWARSRRGWVQRVDGPADDDETADHQTADDLPAGDMGPGDLGTGDLAPGDVATEGSATR